MPAHTKTGLFRPTSQYQVDMTLVIDYQAYYNFLTSFDICITRSLIVQSTINCQQDVRFLDV